MKDQIIALIKEYRAESEESWNPTDGYRHPFAQQHSKDCNRFADNLEKLLKLTLKKGKRGETK